MCVIERLGDLLMACEKTVQELSGVPVAGQVDLAEGTRMELLKREA